MNQFENVYSKLRELTKKVETLDASVNKIISRVIIPSQNFEPSPNITHHTDSVQNDDQHERMAQQIVTTFQGGKAGSRYIERVIPTDEYIHFKEVELDVGTYIVEASCTCVNQSIFNDAGVIMGLYDYNDNERLIASGCGAWYGHVSGDSIAGSQQTVFLRDVLDVTIKAKYRFVIKSIDKRYSLNVTRNNNFPAILTIF